MRAEEPINWEALKVLANDGYSQHGKELEEHTQRHMAGIGAPGSSGLEHEGH